MTENPVNGLYMIMIRIIIITTTNQILRVQNFPITKFTTIVILKKHVLHQCITQDTVCVIVADDLR